jgi:hypothetical protein
MNRGWVVWLVVVALGGCSGVAGDEGASNAAAIAEGQSLAVIEGREWGRCWFDVSGDDARLSCTSTARGHDPLEATVEVVAATMGDPSHALSLKKTLDVEAGGTVILGSVPRASFPVMLLLHATWAREASSAIGNGRGADLWLKPTIQHPEDLPATQAAIMKQPFDLWPAAFIAADPQRSFVVSAQYSLALQPYATFLDGTTMDLSPTFSDGDVKGKIRYFAASHEGSSIPLDVQMTGASARGALTRPGYYAVTKEGIRPATSEEVARDFPAGTNAASGRPSGSESGSLVPEPGPGPTPSPAPSPTPMPVDADPTCGGDGQPKCADGVCDPHTRWDSTLGSCVTCGAASQTYCLDGADNASGEKKCDPGTRFDANQWQCVACGDATQTYCFDGAGNASGNKRCNAGTRFDATQFACIACGGPNQTYCVDDPNNVSGDKTCNAGLHFDASAWSCTE